MKSRTTILLPISLMPPICEKTKIYNITVALQTLIGYWQKNKIFDKHKKSPPPTCYFFRGDKQRVSVEIAPENKDSIQQNYENLTQGLLSIMVYELDLEKKLLGEVFSYNQKDQSPYAMTTIPRELFERICRIRNNSFEEGMKTLLDFYKKTKNNK